MRELLFRGQTRRKGERIINFKGDPMPSNWAEGGILQGKGDFSIIYGYNQERVVDENIKKHVVYSDTVGQYTGVVDKNGKRIFEGDIISVFLGEFPDQWKDIAIVRFHRKLHEWCIVFSVVAAPLSDYDNNASGIEIIGNIYDNPELLEKFDEFHRTTEA